jgi:cystathionine gamma-synthase
MLFPSYTAASRAREFIRREAPLLNPQSVRIVDLEVVPGEESKIGDGEIGPKISFVLFPKANFATAKAFWQHTGEGVSSRRAEFCHRLYDNGLLRKAGEVDIIERACKGPKRYRKTKSIGDAASPENQDSTEFVEERFGRNLHLSFARNAKLAIRRRIAGSLTADVGLSEALQLENDGLKLRKVDDFSEADVYLYPGGMNAIFSTHRLLLAARGQLKSINYGSVITHSTTQLQLLTVPYRFPYIDTLKLLQKFGPGCQFYGFGSEQELDDLEQRLQQGERFLALFCEFPGNPLLKSPNLERIRQLANQYDFLVVVDETIGNFLNVNVLPFVDVLVSSLTKIFSGDSNVMGGR